MLWSVIVDGNDVSQWFGEYLSAFAACGRGESDPASLLAYYGVPLLLTTDDGFFAATSGDQVVAAMRQQVDGMRAAGYGRSEVLRSGHRPERHVRSLLGDVLVAPRRRH